jgi:hypothetical protein
MVHTTSSTTRWLKKQILTMMNNYFKTYEKFVSETELNDKQIAWLFFMSINYGGKLDIPSWSKDNRMGVNCAETMQLLKSKNLAEITEDKYITTPDGYALLEQEFGSKTIYEAIQKCYDRVHMYDPKHQDFLANVYDITRLPITYFIRKNEKLSAAFDKFNVIQSKWRNIWDQKLMEKVLKTKFRKEYNLYKLFQHNYPKQIPTTLKVYRGIKNTYSPDFPTKFTSWSFNMDQAKRFAMYHFSVDGLKPRYAEIQTLLETEILVDDIVLFVGQDEGEVIMDSSTLKDVKVYDLKKEEKE